MIRLLLAPALAAGLSVSALAQTPSPAKAPPAAGSTGSGSKPGTVPVPKSPDTGKKPRQVFILPMKGMVGAGLRHEEMEAVAKKADEYGDGQIIVLRINSGGGDVTEGERIVRTLSKIRERHRLVAWIEEAISGAAFTAFNCREIYFFKVGTMGSITKFYSDSSGQHSAQGRDREAWSDRVAEVAEAGGHNPVVARAMVWSEAIASYTKDPKTGKVTFYPDKTGEVILSDEKDNLTFNADNALACGYINGVADTDAELFEAMQLAPGTFELNDFGRQTGEKWNKTIEQAKKERAAIEQDMAVVGKSSDPETKKLAKMIEIYRRMQSLWKKAPPVAEGMEGGGPLLPQDIDTLAPDLEPKYRSAPDGAGKAKVVSVGIDRCIEDLKKRIAAAKKAQG